MMNTLMNNTAAKISWLALWGMIAVVFASCSSTRDVATSEYDDIYYSSSDYTEDASTVATTRNSNNNYSRQYDYEASRYGDIYDEDDFYYSRRLRRFNQPNYNSWRYYDPFFTNDLYYVINTPVWDSWYNRGWYSWTRPRFGASVAFGFGDPFLSPFASPFAFNRFGAFNSFNYYNPWVRSYYGFDPFFGYRGVGFGSPWGFNAGFYDGFAYAWNGCPPGAFVSSANWRTYNVTRRASTTSLVSQTNYQGRTQNTQRVARPSTVTSTSSARRPNTYLTPKTTTEKNARVNSDYRRRLSSRAADYERRRSSNVSTRNRNSRVGTSSNRNTYRRPSSSVNRDRNSTINRRPSSRPSTIRRPSSNTRRQSSPSYNRRPSSSSSRPSYSRPSSSSSRSSSRPSSSSSSSRRRPQ